MAAPLLDAQRVVLKIRGTDHSVTVDGEAVLWSPVPGCRGDRGCASLCDVVGATADGAAVHVVSYPKRQPWCGGPGGTRAERRDRFAAPSAAEAAAFAERVRAAAAGGRRPRRFLVFVNPKSGQGLSPALYAKKVAPMLAAAGAAVEYVPTAHAGHATEVCAAHGLDGIDAVVAVGGDGLLYECVQGLASRSDADEVLARVALAPVPGGTGNGLAKTLLEASRERYDVTSAVFLLLKGTPKPVDLGHALVEGEVRGWSPSGLLLRCAPSPPCPPPLGAPPHDVPLDRLRHRRRRRPRVGELPVRGEDAAATAAPATATPPAAASAPAVPAYYGDETTTAVRTHRLAPPLSGTSGSCGSRWAPWCA